MTREQPTISIVVPVHNEESILAKQAEGMVHSLQELGSKFELLLVENGSSDQTLSICQELASRLPEVRVLTLPIGDYGMALKHGILSAQHDVVVIFNAEFWSMEFVEIALTALRSRMIIIGSKSAPGAHDDRPLLRRLVTQSYNQILRLVWRFDGTDTHGMKAFWRLPLLPLVRECKTGGWVFDTELVLRAQRAGLSKLELPTDAQELRAPSFDSLLRRVPSVLRNLRLLRNYLPPVPRHGSSSHQVNKPL